MILRQSIRTLYSYAAARSFVLTLCLKFRHETCIMHHAADETCIMLRARLIDI